MGSGGHAGGMYLVVLQGVCDGIGAGGHAGGMSLAGRTHPHRLSLRLHQLP